MKLTLIGGGGVRGPLFVSSCLSRADRLGIDEIALLDTRDDSLRLMAPIAEEMIRRSGSNVRLLASTDPDAAIRDAAYIVTTVRVGGDEARIRDERIALSHGVLGQETTGPGGFAMATRTIPVARRYAELADRLAPNATTFNFSNPAGLVTQALRDAGHDRVVGICDGANAAQANIARVLDVDPDALRAEVFGLNHLSWSRKVLLDGQDVLQPLLADPAFRAGTSLGLFDDEIIDMKRMWINEYLYYYYYQEAAIREITDAPSTRGEEVRTLNQGLFERLESVESPDEALEVYYAYQRQRISTYMPYERAVPKQSLESTPSPMSASRMEEGYAGVALTVIEAMTSGSEAHTALNLPNAGAIDGLLDTDVVEVSCTISDGRIVPDPIEAVPEPELALMAAVKTYERLSAEAIDRRSPRLAIEALMAHPLVVSYPRAKRLVADYLDANRDHVGTWRD